MCAESRNSRKTQKTRKRPLHQDFLLRINIILIKTVYRRYLLRVFREIRGMLYSIHTFDFLIWCNPRFCTQIRAINRKPTAESHWIYIGNPNKQTHKKLQNALKSLIIYTKNKHTTKTLCKIKILTQKLQEKTVPKSDNNFTKKTL